MTFYETLDSIMKQDFGGRGLLASLPASPLAAVSASLAHAKRAVLLTGFPVRMPDGSITGETDGPSGTANLAAALTAAGCGVSVVTDWSSYPHLEAALRFRAPQATLIRLPEQNTDNFIRTFIRDAKPTHLISLERPGKAENGHYHSMRGEQLDDMITDSALFLSAAREAGATVISIGDGGNEMGMGTFRREILAGVPHGELICTAEAAARLFINRLLVALLHMDRRVCDIFQHRIVRKQVKILEYQTVLAADLLHVLLVRIADLAIRARPGCSLS